MNWVPSSSASYLSQTRTSIDGRSSHRLLPFCEGRLIKVSSQSFRERMLVLQRTSRRSPRPLYRNPLTIGGSLGLGLSPARSNAPSAKPLLEGTTAIHATRWLGAISVFSQLASSLTPYAKIASVRPEYLSIAIKLRSVTMQRRGGMRPNDSIKDASPHQSFAFDFRYSLCRLLLRIFARKVEKIVIRS